MSKAVKENQGLLKDLLKRRRQELDLTQRDVARAMGMSSVDYIGMVESGIRRLDLERLPAIAGVLKLSLDTITEMTFREVYGKPETQWLVDMLYSLDKLLVKKIGSLDPASRETVKLMIELIVSKQTPQSYGRQAEPACVANGSEKERGRRGRQSALRSSRNE